MSKEVCKNPTSIHLATYQEFIQDLVWDSPIQYVDTNIASKPSSILWLCDFGNVDCIYYRNSDEKKIEMLLAVEIWGWTESIVYECLKGEGDDRFHDLQKLTNFLKNVKFIPVKEVSRSIKRRYYVVYYDEPKNALELYTMLVQNRAKKVVVVLAESPYKKS